MRNIVAKAHCLMPEFICDFNRYRELKYLDFNRWQTVSSSTKIVLGVVI